MERLECPQKAAEFDRQHKTSARKVKNHAGAIELAGQYTASKSLKQRAMMWGGVIVAMPR